MTYTSHSAPPSPDHRVLFIGCTNLGSVDLQASLQHDGWAVSTASTVAQAAAAVAEQEFVAVVIGVHAPEAGSPVVDGLDVARHLRNAHAFKHLAIIFVAATPQEVQRALDNQVDGLIDVMQAPLEPRLLQHKLALFATLSRERAEIHLQRDEFARANKLNAMMMAVLTHDLRTPMTAVELSAEIVQQRSENESVRKAVTRIKSSIARMVGTIQHLLSMSNVGSELVPVRTEPGNLCEVAHEVISEFQTAKPDAVIEVQCAGDTQAAFDAQRIAQVFSNLIGLAVEHGGPTTPVTVKIDGLRRAYVRISVSVEVAFSEAVRASLFAAVTPPGAAAALPSAGMGLSIVEQLVRAHGGTVVGTSDAASGTVFDVMLPRVETTAEEQATAGRPA